MASPSPTLPVPVLVLPDDRSVVRLDLGHLGVGERRLAECRAVLLVAPGIRAPLNVTVQEESIGQRPVVSPQEEGDNRQLVKRAPTGLCPRRVAGPQECMHLRCDHARPGVNQGHGPRLDDRIFVLRPRTLVVALASLQAGHADHLEQVEGGTPPFEPAAMATVARSSTIWASGLRDSSEESPSPTWPFSSSWTMTGPPPCKPSANAPVVSGRHEPSGTTLRERISPGRRH